VNLLFQITIFYFLSRIIKGYDYFSFVLVGILFSRFFQFWIGVFSENIRMEQYWGTAENLFMSPSRPRGSRYNRRFPENSFFGC